MRVCWNRQTGTFEGRVSIDVWVQVPPLAPKSHNIKDVVAFCYERDGDLNPKRVCA